MSLHESITRDIGHTDELITLVRARAEETHRSAKLPLEVLHSFHDPYIAHQLGLDASAPVRYADLFHTVSELGQACGSTGWAVSVMASSAKISTLLPDAAFSRIHGGDEVALICAGLIPAGTATCDATGWTLNGRWPYVTAAVYADWALLAASIETGDGRPLVHFFAVPRGSYLVEPTWEMSALRATRTDTVVVENLLLGHDYTFDRSDWLAGDSRSERPFPIKQAQVTGGVSFLMPAIGMARSALSTTVTNYRDKSPSGGVRLSLVRATAALHSAEMLVQETARRLDGTAQLPHKTVLELERNGVFSAELLRDVKQSLRQLAGTSGFAQGAVLNRQLGDLEVALSHVSLQFETSTLARYSALLLGE